MCALHTFCLSPPTSPLAQHKAKYPGEIRKASSGAAFQNHILFFGLQALWPWGDPMPWRDKAATGNCRSSWKSLNQIYDPHHDHHPNHDLSWGWGSFAAWDKSCTGRILQAKIWREKKPQVRLWDQNNVIFQKCCGSKSSFSSWGATGRSALPESPVICLGY